MSLADVQTGNEGDSVKAPRSSPAGPLLLDLVLPRGRRLRVERIPVIMGILNITPDSFSDGGTHFDRAQAIDAAMRMIADGAAVLDVGGESTRPGADGVLAEREIERILPVIEGIRQRSDVAISVDTRKAAVAESAIAAGADLVNDVSALQHDPALAGTVARLGVAVILMHMRGEPATMQQLAHYQNVTREVAEELTARRDEAIAAGIASDRILIDPGIGFAKNFEHNLELLANADALTSIAPLVIGASRKAFVGALTGRSAGPARAAGSLAAVAAACDAGAAIVRVHDVPETADFLKVFAALEARRETRQ
jgi:dihydropteroate synthase